MNFSKKTLVALKQAGWHEDYRFEPSNFIEILKGSDFIVSDAAVRFLTYYGNLIIECDGYYFINGMNTLAIDKLSTIIWPKLTPIIAPNSKVFLNATGIECCLVGRCRNEEMALYIDEHGKFYSMDSDACYLVGETVEEAFENLIHGRECQEICELEEVPYVPCETQSSPYQK